MSILDANRPTQELTVTIIPVAPTTANPVALEPTSAAMPPMPSLACPLGMPLGCWQCTNVISQDVTLVSLTSAQESLLVQLKTGIPADESTPLSDLLTVAHASCWHVRLGGDDDKDPRISFARNRLIGSSAKRAASTESREPSFGIRFRPALLGTFIAMALPSPRPQSGAR